MECCDTEKNLKNDWLAVNILEMRKVKTLSFLKGNRYNYNHIKKKKKERKNQASILNSTYVEQIDKLFP